MKAGDDRRLDELLRPLGERTCLRVRKDAPRAEVQLARDAEQRRLCKSLPDHGCRRERRIGVRREHHEIGAAHGLLVHRAGDGADLGTLLLGPVGITRPDHHLVARLDEPPGERKPEVPRTAENRHSHAGTAPSATSASRRRASPSRISVRVTIGRTSPSPSRSSASASSTTSVSIRPG